MDKQKAMMQELWRRALAREDGVAVPCKSASDAVKFRFALYNAVKAARAGKEPADEVLKDAIVNCSVGFDPEKANIVVIRQKVMSGLMQTVAEVLREAGAGEVRSSEELALQEAGERMAKVAQAGTGTPGDGKTTRYY